MKISVFKFFLQLVGLVFVLTIVFFFYLLEMLVQFCLKSMEGCKLFHCTVCDQFSLPLQLSCSSMCLNNFPTPAGIDLSLIKSAVMDLINRSILAKSS